METNGQTPKFVDVHVIHSVPFSNLNRDELGLPKTCVFGGELRARVSSQCVKRTVRRQLESQGRMQAASRTKHLALDAAQILVDRHGWALQDARVAASGMLAEAGIKPYKNSSLTDLVTFLPVDAPERIAEVAHTHREQLREAVDDARSGAEAASGSPAEAAEAAGVVAETLAEARKDKNWAKNLHAAIVAVIKSSNPMVALMGRMLTAMPDADIESAVQVAHPISTNAVEIETDFFTAVDDAVADNPEERGGAMMGTRDYVTGTFYKYAAVDLARLESNLAAAGVEDRTDIARCAADFVEAFAVTVPSANRTTTAPHTPPSLVLVSARSDRPANYANAFESVVMPSASGGGYIAESARRLVAEDAYYGRGGVCESWICAAPATTVDPADGPHSPLTLDTIGDTVAEWLQAHAPA